MHLACSRDLNYHPFRRATGLHVFRRLVIVVLLSLSACSAPGTPTPGASPPPAVTGSPAARATAAATSDLPAPALAADLAATAAVQLVPQPPGRGIRDVAVITLTTPGGETLWAAHTLGARDLERAETHALAVYRRVGGAWQVLARLQLPYVDRLDLGGVRQAQVVPGRVQLVVESGRGEHGGCFDLLALEDAALVEQVNYCAEIPDAGFLDDLNGDSVPEVVLDYSDPYVLCYTCGVRLIDYQPLRWDGAQWVEVKPARVGDGVPEAVRVPLNRALDLAGAMLWKDALALVEQAAAQNPQDETARWDIALLRLRGDRLRAQAAGDAPLLARLLYGDYDAAIAPMRAYTPALVLSQQLPAALALPAGYDEVTTYYITGTTTLALALAPDLAGAYFLRGWALYRQAPGTPAAVADLARAAELAPQDELFQQVAGFIR
jgi:hypothetical protein